MVDDDGDTVGRYCEQDLKMTAKRKQMTMTRPETMMGTLWKIVCLITYPSDGDDIKKERDDDDKD